MELSVEARRNVEEGHDDEAANLERAAYRIRRRSIEMAARGGCFLGSALSAADALAFLYGRFLRVSPDSFGTPERDYFLLSKGHAVPALYGALVEHGFFEESRLERHLDVRDSVYWHPNRDLPGVDFHFGSLGHALGVGTGIALDIKLRRREDRVVVLAGDGELNEGSIWEALLFASARQLDNLVLVVDRNGLQANEATEALVPLEPLTHKLRAFGCRVTTCDGHSFDDMGASFREANESARGGPMAIVLRTIRGKGLPSMEGRAEAWFVKLDPTELGARLAELDANVPRLAVRRKGAPRP